MKKIIALTKLFANPLYSERTTGGMDLIYMKKYFEAKGYEVIIIGMKNTQNKNLDFYYDANDDIPYCNALYIQPSHPNFYGGGLKYHGPSIVERFAYIDPKSVYTVLTDPLMLPNNPAFHINKRFGVLGNYIELWQEIIENQNYIMPGRNEEKFMPEFDFSNANIIYEDVFKHMFSNLIQYSDFTSTKEYDVIYYGVRRGRYRENKLKQFLPNISKNLVIGYKDCPVRHNFIKRVKQPKLHEYINKAYVTLIIGDEEHNNNVTTFRFYEGMSSSALCAIDVDFDPHKLLIKNEELRNLLYVEKPGDLIRIGMAYSERLIKLQHEELKRILND